MGKLAQQYTLENIYELLSNPLHSKSFFDCVSQGAIKDCHDYSAYGINSDVDTASVPEDIWLQGGLFSPPTTYTKHNIVSDSANDTFTGTGATVIKVTGPVVDGLVTEYVQMNGVSNVSTVNAFADVDIEVYTAGSGNTNAGIITATSIADGTVTASIQVNGRNSARKAIRLIPQGYTGYLYGFQAGMYQATVGSTADVYCLIKRKGGVWIDIAYHSLSNSGNNVEVDEFRIPIKLEAGTWIKAQCTGASSNNTLVQSRFNLIIVKNIIDERFVNE